MERSKLMFIDPPEGWRYGFPKLYGGEFGEPLKQWCLENGYKPSFDGWDSHIMATFISEEEAQRELNEPFDYTKWRESLFEGMSIDEINEHAAGNG